MNHNSDNPKIAIVLPVYNTEKYIIKSLESISKQTYNNFHIFAINDGSTDRSLNILKDYQHKEQKLTVIDKKNTGSGDTRNVAIEQISRLNFDYITFIDSDDTVSPTFLEDLIKTAIREQADICLCGYNKLIGDSIINDPYKFFPRSHQLTTQEFVTLIFSTLNWYSANGNGGMVWKGIYKLNIIKNVRFTTLPIVEDELYNIQLLQYVNKIFYVSKALYNYRSHENQTVKKNNFKLKMMQGRELCVSTLSNYSPEIYYLSIAALTRALSDLQKETGKIQRKFYSIDFRNKVYASYQNGYLTDRDWKNYNIPYHNKIIFKLKYWCRAVKKLYHSKNK